jgi:hypothetical protein
MMIAAEPQRQMMFHTCQIGRVRGLNYSTEQPSAPREHSQLLLLHGA